jgi:hypothetical protein
LERLVLQLQQQSFGDRHLKGEEGLEALLAVVLTAVAGTAGASVDAQALELARVDSYEWQVAAQSVLNKRMHGFGWLIV